MSVPGWFPDPCGRHEYRWWDGSQWTDQVADGGVTGVDPPGEENVPPPPPDGGEQSGPTTDFSRRFEESHWDGEAPLLASKWQRVGAYFLEAALSVITLWIGWVVWSLVVYGRGQTPAKQVLNLRVVAVDRRRCLSWGQMAAREWVLKGPLVFVVVTIALAAADVHEGWTLVVYPGLAAWWLINFILLLADGRRQTAWDKLLNAVVINDHDRRFAPKNARQESPPARQFSEDRAW